MNIFLWGIRWTWLPSVAMEILDHDGTNHSPQPFMVPNHSVDGHFTFDWKIPLWKIFL